MIQLYGGVGKTSKETMWSIYKNRKYEEQSIESQSLRAHESVTYHIRVEMAYVYDEVEFKVEGTDDNGHRVSLTNRYSLHYVGLWLKPNSCTILVHFI